MGLLAPLALVAIPLLGAIIALYLLRMRRPSAPIASLELWDESVRDREANTLWQRLQFSVLLILQLLVLFSLIVALARPWVKADAASGQNLVLIVDTSASMGTTDADARRSTRLDAAKRKALDLIDNLQAGQVASLISANSHASVLVSAVDDKAKLRAAIVDLQVQPAAPTDFVAALKLANALAAKQSDTVIWALSDGRFPPARDQVGAIAAQIQYFQVGNTSDNQGITALSLDNSEGSVKLFAQVFNADAFTVTRRVDFVVDDVPWDARTLTIPPGATQEIILDNVPLGARVISAGFSVPDTLAIDDRAWTINRAAVPGTVLLVTSGNKFLESALSLLPNVDLYKVEPVSYSADNVIDGAPPDVVVFDLAANIPQTDTLPSSNIFLIAPPANGPYIQSTLVITNPTGIRQGGNSISGGATQETDAPASSLLKFVDFSEVHIQRTSVLDLPAWATEVLSSDEGPLMVAGEVDGRRIAAIGFDIKDTDLPLQPAFPLMVRNLMTYLLPAAQGGVPVSVQPGTSVQINAASDDVDTILVEDPEGIEWSYEVSASSERVEFPETRTPGVYYITEYVAGKVAGQEAFAVNLFSRDESNVGPVSAPQLPDARPSLSTGTISSNRSKEVWPIVAFIGFLLLLVEWLYAQRIVIRRAITAARTRRALRKLERVQ